MANITDENSKLNFGVLLGVDYMRIEKMVLPSDVNKMEALRNAIGCEYVELVHPEALPWPYVMVVDEEGLMKDEPSLNVIGSYLYGTYKHGSPIVGNAVIMKEQETDEGVDLAWLTGPEVVAMEKRIEDIWKTAVMKMAKYYEDQEA